MRFVPFDPETRRTESLVDLHGRRVRLMKGVLATVAAACGIAGDDLAHLESRTASRDAGVRTLAVARGAETGAMQLLGVLHLTDPPRPDAPQLVGVLRDLGVRVKMLTGDALPVARAIAAQLGLGEIERASVVSSADGQSPRIIGVLDRVDGLAEVYPADKYGVVRQLQRAGHIVGMTGDGVNDAPALRQAEVGIAVSDATDIAKGAASVILTQPGLANIVALIEQGRTIYQRILTWVINKISRTILKASVVAIAFIVTGRFVISAFAMLVLVFMTDFAKVSLATDNVRWSRRPEHWNLRAYVGVSVVLGVLMVIEALALIAAGWTRFSLSAGGPALDTFTFLTMLYFGVCSIASLRERRWFWASAPSWPVIAALAADVALGTLLTRLGIPGLAPLPWAELGVVLTCAIVACLLVNDTVKVMLVRRWAPAGAA